jgi:hypothetical protein
MLHRRGQAPTLWQSASIWHDTEPSGIMQAAAAAAQSKMCATPSLFKRLSLCATDGQSRLRLKSAPPLLLPPPSPTPPHPTPTPHRDRNHSSHKSAHYNGSTQDAAPPQYSQHPSACTVIDACPPPHTHSVRMSVQVLSRVSLAIPGPPAPPGPPPAITNTLCHSHTSAPYTGSIQG